MGVPARSSFARTCAYQAASADVNSGGNRVIPECPKLSPKLRVVWRKNIEAHDLSRTYFEVWCRTFDNYSLR